MLETLDRILRRLFLRNLHLKVIAALLTLALYIWVSVDREVERTREAPLQITPPSGMVLVNDPPDKTAITIRGKWSDLARLESAELDPINVEVDTTMGETGRVSLSPELVDLPPGLRAVDIEPNYVKFRLADKHRKEVRVRANLVGEPADAYEISNVRLTPSTIDVSGPATALESISAVSTEPIDVTGRTESFTQRVRPRLDDPLVEYQLDDPLEVEVTLHAQEIRRTIPDLEVRAVNTVYPTAIEPQQVNVTIRGPKGVIDQLDKDHLHASLDLSGEQNKRPGALFEREVEIRNLPRGVEVLEKQPSHFRIRLLADTTPSDPESGTP